MNDNEIEKSTQLLRKEHQQIESSIITIADIIKELENGVALDRRRMWEIHPQTYFQQLTGRRTA